MQVILLQDVQGTGKKGQLIEVSDGYGKNYLVKKGLAEIATAAKVNELNQRNKADEYHKAEEIKAIKELAAKVKGASVTCKIRVGANGKVFGSVTSGNISDALREIGFEVDKKKILLSQAIKTLGTYDVEVRFMEGVQVKISVNVVAEE